MLVTRGLVGKLVTRDERREVIKGGGIIIRDLGWEGIVGMLVKYTRFYVYRSRRFKPQ